MKTYNVRNFKIKTKEALDIVSTGETVLIIRGGELFRLEKFSEKQEVSEPSLSSEPHYPSQMGGSRHIIAESSRARAGSISETS